ncbi:MAG: glycosyltransferase family 39 protein [Candidatus Omnitrophica bacterium]|nr:glycosyltransferase family 39 protein [Candidatus Omnitrophota bacterium]
MDPGAKYRWPLYLLLLLCFFTRLSFIRQIPAEDFFYPDGTDYSRVASAITQGEGFYPPEMKPVIAYRAPLYCFFLGGVYWLFGIENLTAVRLVHCFLAMLTGWIIYLISERIWGAAGGLLSLFIFSIHPFFVYHAATIAPEIVFTLFVVLTYYFLFRLFDEKTAFLAILAGIPLGLAALTKGTVLLLGPAAALTIFSFTKANWGRRLGLVFLLGSMSLLVISPLSYWIYKRWNQVSLMLDGSGMNFWIANSPHSAHIFKAKTASQFRSAQQHLWMEVLPAMSKRLEHLSPGDRDRIYYKMGWREFEKNPERSLWLMAERFRIFWRPWVHPLAYGPKEVFLSGIASLPLFFIGFLYLFSRFRAKTPEACFTVLSIILITLVVGMVNNTEIRFRVPLIDTLLIVYAGGLIGSVFPGSEPYPKRPA